MNDHQKRLWQDMISTTDKYLSGVISYSQMVKNLEGLKDAGDFPESLMKKWFKFWIPLEILNAKQAAEFTDTQNVRKEVAAMKKFLLDHREP